jgi:hypothetical protein
VLPSSPGSKSKTIKQTSKQANKQAIKQVREQASKQAAFWRCGSTKFRTHYFLFFSPHSLRFFFFLHPYNPSHSPYSSTSPFASISYSFLPCPFLIVFLPFLILLHLLSFVSSLFSPSSSISHRSSIISPLLLLVPPRPSTYRLLLRVILIQLFLPLAQFQCHLVAEINTQICYRAHDPPVLWCEEYGPGQHMGILSV